MSSDQSGASSQPPGSTPPGPPAGPPPSSAPPGAPPPQRPPAPGTPAPPAYPPHAHAAPGSPPPSGGGKRTGLIIAIVVAALLLVATMVVGLVLVLAADSDESGGSDDPSTTESEEGYLAVVEEYTQAFDDRDCATLAELRPSQFEDEADCEERFPYDDADDLSVDVTDTEVTDLDDEDDPTEASVRIYYTLTTDDTSGDEVELEFLTDFELEKDGDDWIVIDAIDEQLDDGQDEGSAATPRS